MNIYASDRPKVSHIQEAYCSGTRKRSAYLHLPNPNCHREHRGQSDSSLLGVIQAEWSWQLQGGTGKVQKLIVCCQVPNLSLVGEEKGTLHDCLLEKWLCGHCISSREMILD